MMIDPTSSGLRQHNPWLRAAGALAHAALLQRGGLGQDLLAELQALRVGDGHRGVCQNEIQGGRPGLLNTLSKIKIIINYKSGQVTFVANKASQISRTYQFVNLEGNLDSKYSSWIY